MPVLNLPFVDDESPLRYQARLSRVFEAPDRDDVFRCPLYENPDGDHSMHMAALCRDSHHQDWYNDMQDHANLLMARAKDVEGALLYRNTNHLCALLMIAWHLVDDTASLPNLHPFRERDFSTIEMAVWAALAFFRDMWSLHPYFDENDFVAYLNTVVHLIDVLRRHGVHVAVAI